MKLLDFTGRKVDPSLMMGFKENKKDEDPSIKVGFIISLNTDHLNHRFIEPTNLTFLLCFTPLKIHQRRKRRLWKRETYTFLNYCNIQLSLPFSRH